MKDTDIFSDLCALDDFHKDFDCFLAQYSICDGKNSSRRKGFMSISETIIDQLKNISQIEHSRHRSLTNFFVNILGGFVPISSRKPNLQF